MWKNLSVNSQEVREAILGVHKHFHHEVGWRQRHGARFLVPGYGWKKKRLDRLGRQIDRQIDN